MSKDTGTLDLFKGVRDTEVAMIIAQCAVTFGTDSSQFRDLVERMVIPPPISRRQKWNFLVPFPEEVP
ncbi:hypothetical protein [Xanthomonas citri]|uniref:hypothetical protein n=1 Tax=Xanthomonas citri TaxID=346 RepID=UPI001C639D6F|nr:hypothetical protein [Xanthomonas citri]